MTVIILAMAIVGAGCGAKSNSSETAQAETTVKEEKKEVTKSNKQDINTNDINNSNIDSEDIMQDEDSMETSDMSTGKQESNDSAKASKDTAKTTDKKVVKANSESNTTSSRNTTTNNTTAVENNSGKSNNTQQNTNSSSSNNNSSTQTESTQAAHTHTWQHIEATGHYETVVVQAAWDEEIPIYKTIEVTRCSACNADISNWANADIDSHMYQHMLRGENGGYYSKGENVQIGTNTISHAAITEKHWVQDSPAYDRCTTCGEIK